MALLATVVGLVEALGAVRSALAGGQLPTRGAHDALVVPGATAGLATDVATGTHAPVAVVTPGARGGALPSLKLKRLDRTGTKYFG